MIEAIKTLRNIDLEHVLRPKFDALENRRDGIPTRATGPEPIEAVLPMGVRETRFSMAYCHPYMNPMTEPDDMEGHHEG